MRIVRCAAAERPVETSQTIQQVIISIQFEPIDEGVCSSSGRRSSVGSSTVISRVETAVEGSLLRGAKSTEANPWNEYADTLEWTLPSPPPEHTFEILPKQEDWDNKHAH